MSVRPAEIAPAEFSSPGSPLWAVVFAWVFPGAGHFYLGRRKRAVLFAAIVLSMFAYGLFLGGRIWKVESNDPFSMLATGASMGLGTPYFLSRSFLGYEIQEGNIASVTYEYGITFALTAAIMNLLLMLDAWDIASGKKK